LENTGYSHGVDVKITVDENLSFHSDENLINTVMQNLIENAMKYKNPSIEHPYVKINVVQQSNGIRMTITDNGQGIPEDQQSTVFDMFVKAHQDSEGSGLGLYIVKKSMHKLGGTITLKSQEGAGTTFDLFIPDQQMLSTKESSNLNYANN